ncbi:hypothetical protein [Limosilactobacillus reuteri]
MQKETNSYQGMFLKDNLSKEDIKIEWLGYSATDLMAEIIISSVKIKIEWVNTSSY